MGAVQTSIALSDRVSPVLFEISNNIQSTLNMFNALNVAVENVGNMANPISVSQVVETNNAIQNIQRNYNDTEEKIRECVESQQVFNESVKDANIRTQTLVNKAQKLAGTLLSIQGVKKLLDTSDKVTQSEQRLKIVKDNYDNQTQVKSSVENVEVNYEVNNNALQTIDDIQNSIFKSANNARVDYSDTIAQVSKLGMNASQSFANIDQIIMFVEQFNKLAVLGGASAVESANGMYQLTQSMAKGKLDGDELRAVFEGMPLVAQKVAKYMDVDVGTMKELASQGMVTANIVRDSLLSSAKDTNEEFQKLNYTWEQIFTIFKNGTIRTLQPLLNTINLIANNTERTQRIFTTLGGGVFVLSKMLEGLFNGIDSVFSFFERHLTVTAWLLTAGIGLLSVYIGVAGGYAVAQGIMAVVGSVQNMVLVSRATALLANINMELLATSSTYAYAIATAQATVAQSGFTAALLANPFSWIVILIVGVIATLISLIIHFNKTGSTATNVFSNITGAVNVVIQFFVNLLDAAKMVGTNIGIAFSNGWADAQAGIFSFVHSALGAILKVGNALNSLPFVSFDLSGLERAANIYAEKAAAADDYKKEYVKLNVFHSGWVQDAYNKGANWGNNALDKIKAGYDSTQSIGDLQNTINDISDNVGNTASDTGAIKNSLDISTEELQWLCDIAEREVINQYTTVPLTVNFSTTNNVGSDMDLDGIIKFMEDELTEAVNGCAEVVHF